MNAETLQTFLHQFIPATALLGLTVNSIENGTVTLTLPHELNHNHKHTAFGGSIALGATSCGWAWVHAHFPEAEGNIVIQHGETDYLRPAGGDLRFQNRPIDAEAWQQFQADFAATGKGKIRLVVEVWSEDKLAALFRGTFVAIQPKAESD